MRRWIWGGIILFFVLFSLTPMFYEFGRMGDLRPERYFELVHNFYTDYNFYLSRIRQGREGANVVHEKYTSEPHEGSYIQVMYLLMGKVSAWIGVPWPRSGDTYHTARIVLSFTLLALISYAARVYFKQFLWQIIAFFLAVTSASWPIAVHLPDGSWRFGGYMPWWTMMDSLQRITFVPHMLAGQALMVFLILAMTNRDVMRRPGNWIFLGFLALLLGVIFPPGLLFVGAVVGVYVLIGGLRELGGLRSLWGLGVIGIISAPSLLYLSLALRVYPWKRLTDYAILHPQPFDLREYLLAVGAILVLGVLGGLWVLWKKEKRLYPLLAWAIAWISCIVIFKYVPGESPLRFTEMLPHVPLAFLGVYFLSHVSNVWKKTSIVLAAFLIIMGLGQMHSYWLWAKDFLDQKIIASYPAVPTGSYVMYPLKDLVETMIWLQDHTTRDTVILSETTAGNYTPVYSGNTVYVGHAGTVATEQKEAIVKNFFSGNMEIATAREFLETNNLHYILFGPQESEDGGVKDLITVYPFLTEVYRQGLFAVYRL